MEGDCLFRDLVATTQAAIKDENKKEHLMEKIAESGKSYDEIVAFLAK